MKYIDKITFFILLFSFTVMSFGQTCGEELVIEICDMTIFDSDNSDGLNIPDGITNVYDQYVIQYPMKTPVLNGVWISVNSNFGQALSSDGTIRLWNLPRSTSMNTEDDEKYIFELQNGDCTGVALTLELILSPYSGETLPPNPSANGANVEICDANGINLINTLFTNESQGIPAAHANGVWEYTGSKPYVTVSGETASFEIPDDENVLIDQEIFEFSYTVSSTSLCNPSQTTIVTVSAIRQPKAGESTIIQICEDDIKAGLFDMDINLRDDFLIGEDPGGDWAFIGNDVTNQISTPADFTINLKDIYNNLISPPPTGQGLRFGCETFTIQYTVRDRSGKCVDDVATIQFVFYEELRPFSQTAPIPQICATEPDTFDLLSLIDFTTEDGILFRYTDSRYTNWRLVSGPSDLGLIQQGAISFTAEGTVTTRGQTPGTYVFEYGVQQGINCVVISDLVCDPFGGYAVLDPNFTPCDSVFSQVTIEILPFDYAGEDTPSDPTMMLEFCESEEAIDLRSVLETNGTAVVPTGVWTDTNGAVVPNNFVIPTLTTDPQIFNFTYSTSNSSGCMDSATLSFSVSEEPKVGLSEPLTVCRSVGSIELFDQLSGADQSGFWRGPVGYDSEGDGIDAFKGILDMSLNWKSGNYIYTLPANGACLAVPPITISVEVEIIESLLEIGDLSTVLCKEEGQINLFTLLPNNTDINGVFSNEDGVLTDGVFVFNDLEEETYDFIYTINGDCEDVTANVEVLIIEIQQPDLAEPTEFCILEAKTLTAIENIRYNDMPGGSTLDNIIWYAAPDGDETVPANTLLVDGQKFYVAAAGVDGCESTRLEVEINILNLGEGDCTLEFQDGVSPNVPGANDSFNITQWRDQDFNIPTVFEGFELQIFNRYGTLVYKGNQNTEEFRGISNAGIQLGKDLPSGVYFYILNPNKNENRPIQGNFYLSK